MRPLIHVISNEATLNDVVNVILAAGGRAICANSPDEVAEITSISDALVLNIGMPCKEKLEAMIIAGKAASKKRIPVVLDPVGAGASGFRNEILSKLLENISFACIKGNRAEIAALCGIKFRSEGVESTKVELSTAAIKALAAKTGAIIVVTGEVNIVSDENTSFEVKGGSKLLTRITGSGCMLAGIIALRLAERNKSIGTIMSALAYFNQAAKEAELMSVGTASYRINLIDLLSERSFNG